MTVFITGAAGGLGRAAVNRFAAAGAQVYACDLREISECAGVRAFRADIAREEDIAAVGDRLAREGVRLDCIVNLAGIHLIDSFLEIDEERLQKIVNVNLLGAVRVNRALFPLLNPGGKIIVVTSEVAPLAPLPFNGVYSVTKTALDSYAQALRQEAGLLGVKVVTVRPGAFDTPLANGSITAMREMSARNRYFRFQADRLERIMSGFTGKPADPDRLAALLCRIARSKHPRCVYRVHANPFLILLGLLPKGTQVRLIRRLLSR